MTPRYVHFSITQIYTVANYQKENRFQLNVTFDETQALFIGRFLYNGIKVAKRLCRGFLHT